MAEYIFPAFIFITSMFILCTLGRGAMCIIISIVISIILDRIVLSASDSSTIIYSITFMFELLLFLIITFDKKSENMKTSLYSYFILITITFLINARSYSRDKDETNREIKAKNKIRTYKEQYNFNVDTFLQNTVIKEKIVNSKKEIELPIIIYRKWNEEIEFDYDFNKSININLKTFSYDSLKTIILIDKNEIDKGEYTNGTKAKQIEIVINFIDKQTKRVYFIKKIEGGYPPSSVSYRKNYIPERQTGTIPTDKIIINTINYLLTKEQ